MLLRGLLLPPLCMFVLVGLVAVPGLAEIERTTRNCTGTREACFHWWPKLVDVPGWYRDTNAFFGYDTGIWAQDGFNFSNADTVIYAKAELRTEFSSPTLEIMIAGNQRGFQGQYSNVKIEKVKSLVTADGQSLQTYTYVYSDRGTTNWEHVAFGKESEPVGVGDEKNRYFLIFVITSRSQAGYRKNLPVYEKMVSSYRTRYPK